MKVKPLKQLLAENPALVVSEMQKVSSHQQRQVGDWVQNTVMIENSLVPFKYRRMRKQQSLKGAQVDVVYYPEKETIAGIEMEVMKVVRISRS